MRLHDARPLVETILVSLRSRLVIRADEFRTLVFVLDRDFLHHGIRVAIALDTLPRLQDGQVTAVEVAEILVVADQRPIRMPLCQPG